MTRLVQFILGDNGEPLALNRSGGGPCRVCGCPPTWGWCPICGPEELGPPPDLPIIERRLHPVHYTGRLLPRRKPVGVPTRPYDRTWRLDEMGLTPTERRKKRQAESAQRARDTNREKTRRINRESEARRRAKNRDEINRKKREARARAKSLMSVV